MAAQRNANSLAKTETLKTRLYDARADADEFGSAYMLSALAGKVDLHNNTRLRQWIDAYLLRKKTTVRDVAQKYLHKEITVNQYQKSMMDNIITGHINTIATAAGGYDAMEDGDWQLVNQRLTKPHGGHAGELVLLLLLVSGLSAGLVTINQSVVQRSVQYMNAPRVSYELERFNKEFANAFTTAESRAAAAAARQAAEELQKANAALEAAHRQARQAEGVAAQRSAAEALERARINAERAERESNQAQARAVLAAPAGATLERSVRHARDSCFGCVTEAARGWVPIGTLVPIGERDCDGNCRCTQEFKKED